MRTIFLILFGFLAISIFAGNEPVDKTIQAKEWLKNQPLAFIENKGQFTDAEGKPAENVLFKASYGNCDIYITTKGLSYVFVKYEKKQEERKDIKDLGSKFGEKGNENLNVSYYRLDMNLEGSNIGKAQIVKEMPGKQGVTNYFYPHCPEGIYGMHEYGKITIKNIYKGIDWVIYTNADNKESPLKYDFVIQPQANYKDIRIKFVNAQSTQLTDNGTKLKIQTIAGNIEEGNLYSYQENSAEKKAIKTNYKANNDSSLEFEISDYDKTKTLIIDPIVWATYYGGGNSDQMISICPDSHDNIYITGYTFSTDFPVKPLTGAFEQANSKGMWDTFILKFNDQGVRQWATYYGGNLEDFGRSICVDTQDNIYILGDTYSTNFPILPLSGAYFQGIKAGEENVFIIKFNNLGERQWSTYYGGNYYDKGYSICSDSKDNIYFTGSTRSTNFPIQPLTGAYNQSNNADVEDAFIVKFNNQGVIQWSTYYGGKQDEYASAIGIDSKGNIYITGETSSSDFPTKVMTGAYFQGGKTGIYSNAFFVKFNNLGVRQWATYYGGSVAERGNSMCFNSHDDLYITGVAQSNDFPLKYLAGAYNQTMGTGELKAFILKFNNLGVRQWATAYGGIYKDQAYSICSDSLNSIYVTGSTYSSDFASHLPTQYLPGEYFKAEISGELDAFILKFDSTGARQWATYYGGGSLEDGTGVTVDNKNSVYFIGASYGNGAYTKDYGNGAYFDDTWNGAAMYSINGFILKVEPCNNQKPTSVQTNRNNICINETGNIILTAIGGIGDTLKWYSDNAGLNYLGKGTPFTIPVPAQTTTYYARWESRCDTSECDSVVVQIYTVITKTQSQKICQGNAYSIGHSTYIVAGTYTDTIPTISGCDSIITTNLTVNPIERTVRDTSICDGESFTFGNHRYTKTGTYQDTLTSVVYGCDSIITTNLTVNPTFLTPPQRHAICEGETFTIGTHIYTKAGIYKDILKTYLNCDSIVITDLTVNPLPMVSLGDDKLICPGDSIILSPGQGFNSYLWSDGSVLSNLKVTSPGTYQVTVFNDWCSASAEMNINECGTELWFPNAFSPNNDNKNESFKPVKLGTLNTYYILIYNQWGQQVYESNDAYTGWDGSFKGSSCATGQYVYVATYTMGSEPATQKLRVNRGAFTLLR